MVVHIKLYMNNHNALNICRNPKELDKYAEAIAMQKLVHKIQYLDHFEEFVNCLHTIASEQKLAELNLDHFEEFMNSPRTSASEQKLAELNLDHFEEFMNSPRTSASEQKLADLKYGMQMSVRMGFDLDGMRQMTHFHRSKIYQLDVEISELMAIYTKLQPDSFVQGSISILEQRRDAHRYSVCALHNEMRMYAP
jgi:hypothetical protein